MEATDYLCKQGFYGVKIEDLTKKDKEMYRQSEKTEIVTGKSVKRVKETQNPEEFVKIGYYEPGAYLRATNHEFMSYVTRGRFKFSCPEYYFIFHELLQSPGYECSSGELRLRLKIGAKSFFYFIKKLCLVGLIEKSKETIKIIDKEVETKEEEKEYICPKNYLKNVPIYTQVWRMMEATEKGVCAQDIKEALGMDNKPALHVLKKIMEWNSDKVIYVTGFEGKVRRNWYKLKKIHEDHKKAFLARLQTTITPQNEVVDVEIRKGVIEQLVTKHRVMMYNKHFHQALSEALGTKHMVDKNTVTKTACASKRIDLVQVYITYSSKRITRNVLKSIEIPSTAPEVIEAITKEGYRKFSLVTPTGVVDYDIKDSDVEKERPAHESASTDLTAAKVYFKALLFKAYNAKYVAASNGYLLNKAERYSCLLKHWMDHQVTIIKDFRSLDDLPLGVFIKAVPIYEPQIVAKITNLCPPIAKAWSTATFRDFRAIAPSTLQKHFTSKTYLRTFLLAVTEMEEAGCLQRVDSEGQIYRVLATTYPETSVSSVEYLAEDKRQVLYQQMVDLVEKRKEQASWLPQESKRVFYGLAVDVIRRADISQSAKEELLDILRKTEGRKKTYPLPPALNLKYLAKQTPYLTIYGQNYTSQDIIMAFAEIKETLMKTKEIVLLQNFYQFDYFLLECIILSLSEMSVVTLPSTIIVSNNICVATISMHAEYKRSLKDGLEYAQTFCLDNVFKSIRSDDLDLSGALQVYKHLIHKGSSTVGQLLKTIPSLALFELEDILAVHPQLFKLVRCSDQFDVNKCLVVLS
ncbi:hypothetical protein NEHOM01_2312 [Nematocida homosporus]|uniref:uncharacterized protein n=1 Tax=Nematocida homosporus TaxID=1912981 RepID=UPI002220A574|nr:uncharacterized protein NEHOM01_2312 [Nematocida homosporus]KAI5187614.1 hypothetical protein NEHOM01_2312 [Nematocida homosporus]